MLKNLTSLTYSQNLTLKLAFIFLPICVFLADYVIIRLPKEFTTRIGVLLVGVFVVLFLLMVALVGLILEITENIQSSENFTPFARFAQLIIIELFALPAIQLWHAHFISEIYPHHILIGKLVFETILFSFYFVLIMALEDRPKEN